LRASRRPAHGDACHNRDGAPAGGDELTVTNADRASAEHPAARHAWINQPNKAVLRRPTLNRRLFLIVLLLALGVAVLATAIQGPALWDVESVRSFQGSAALKLPMEAVTTLGSEEFFLLLLSLVFWCIDKELGIDLALLLMIAGTVNITLKAFLQRPRPFWSNPALRLTSGPSFSTPSGHAANATVLFGYLAWRFAGRRPRNGQRQSSPRRGVIAALLLLLIFLVCLSRVYLGVHFPGDVIWGCAEGIVLLAAYIGLKPRAAAWLRRRSLGTHVAMAVGAAAAILALNLAFLQEPRFLPAGGFLQAAYVAARVQASSEAGNVAGLVLGVWVGLALERRYVRFTTSGPAMRRALRYVVGLAGLLTVWLGLRLILPVEPLALGMALRVVRYAAAALWTVFAWPWLFVRAGLGKAERPADTSGRTA
jgi:membrane-associated phospholipid phosphatase